MKTEKAAKLFLILVMTVLALGGLGYGLYGKAVATTSAPDSDIVFSPEDAPAYGRAAPYGQWLVTHSAVEISTTRNYGTVARTNGYQTLKAIFCAPGAGTVTGTLVSRLTSSGSVYTITGESWVFPANTKTVTTTENIAPWMSLGLTADVSSTTTCGIYVQTP